MSRLDDSTRSFLHLVERAAFANPFTDERMQLDLQIGGVSSDATPVARLDAMSANIRDVLAAIQRQTHGFSDLPRADRALVRYARLFDIFHRFLERFDTLIDEQLEAGSDSCRVSFAADALRALRTTGLDADAALRTFSMFYQLRRAYYFIDQALVGRSPCMRRLRCSLWNSVFTSHTRLYEQLLWDRMEDFSTLLLGETGTGKGTAAAAIGRSGFIPFDTRQGCFAQSFTDSFLPINLSQFPAGLIESELFGHKKGAFTGAVESHEGAFSRCNPYGAIFLDEIGDVPVPVQIKLLQVLQERRFSPVGSHRVLRFRGRVIAATNKPLRTLRTTGAFRDDFYYRLSSDVITVPSLRQRLDEDPSELDELVGLVMRRTVGKASNELVELAKKAIERDLPANYRWPGNVREIEQCVRRILLTGTYQGDSTSPAQPLSERLHNGIETGRYTASALLADYCRLLYNRHGTYEAVARRADIDRRTVKKYIETNR